MKTHKYTSALGLNVTLPLLAEQHLKMYRLNLGTMLKVYLKLDAKLKCPRIETTEEFWTSNFAPSQISQKKTIEAMQKTSGKHSFIASCWIETNCDTLNFANFLHLRTQLRSTYWNCIELEHFLCCQFLRKTEVFCTVCIQPMVVLWVSRALFLAPFPVTVEIVVPGRSTISYHVSTWNAVKDNTVAWNFERLFTF